MSRFEEKMNEFLRRGDEKKLRWMKNIEKTILPGQIKRIQQNDKTVLMEMVIPKWVDWRTLYEWAQSKKEPSAGKICILCDLEAQNSINFLQKEICESCFLKLKHMQ